MHEHEVIFTEVVPPSNPIPFLRTMLEMTERDTRTVHSDRFKALLILIISQSYGDRRKQFNISSEYDRLAALYRAGKL